MLQFLVIPAIALHILRRKVDPRLRQTVKYNNSMSDLPLRIRTFVDEDLDALHQIDRVCFPMHMAFSRGEIASYLHLAAAIVLVAEVEGIVGFVLASVDGRSQAHVITLDVLPDVRRQRVATSLMEELHRDLDRLRVGVSLLEVAVNNAPARRLYEKLDYQYVGAMRGYYQGKEDAFRMARIS